MSRRVGRRDFAVLVEKLRSGPPRLSPYAVPQLDAVLNTLEFFVHHEDIRRAQPGWTPRDLGDDGRRCCGRCSAPPARACCRRSPVGVTAENSVTGSRSVLKAGAPTVTVRGLPSEVTLFVFGRPAQAQVELLGDDAAVARLTGTSLGI